MLAIEVQDLKKHYGATKAVDGISLTVAKGEVFGMLGPNGAGKTTAIRCLLDLIHRDGGEISVLGIDPAADPVEVKRRTGYMPGELHFDQSMTPEALFRYFNDLRSKAADWAHVRSLADRLDLAIKQPIRNLSHGNKQKVGIIQALMHKPELIIMDEPTQGLDPLMQQEVLRLLREAQAAGSTVFFSSHIMSEVESVAQRVGIIRGGRMVEVADPKTLGTRSLNRIHIRFKKMVDSTSLGKIKGVTLLSEENGNGVRLQVEGEVDDLIKALANFPVRDFETERPRLEEAFLAFYDDAKE